MTDGLGGYASTTVSGLRTRREHGLLVVADAGRAVRHVGLAALDLTLTLPSGARAQLYSHDWVSGANAPAGHRYLETFSLVEGVPRWRWRVGDVVVEREIAARHGHPSVAVVHRVIAAPGPVGLAVSAMCTWRESTRSRDASGPALKVEQVSGGVTVEDAYRISGPGWQAGGEWHLGARTREDGGAEDLWLAGNYVERVNPGESLEISAWAGDLGRRPPAARLVIDQARERARRITAGLAGVDATLTLAADAFVTRGPDLVTGYPFASGGDPLAGYEGLFLATGRHDEGRKLLRSRAEDLRGGSPLWLAHAADRHVAATGDTDLAAELAGPLGRLLGPDDDLLRVGRGRPVELNALWVNALAAHAGLLAAAGRDDAAARARLARVRDAFAARFPAPEGWLYDVVDGPPSAYPLGGASQDDPTLRAGQLLAWSLPHAPLAGDAAALRALGPALLTPLGPRTLSPREYGYDGREGAAAPWLIGAWADACAAAGLPTEGLLTGLEAHLGEYGLGSISDAADGEPPHRALGCPFSARSVAELLRVRKASRCES